MTGRIVVDELQHWPTKLATFKAGSCHLMVEADEHGQLDLEALHDFAASIGLKREWFQPKSSPHYDLNGSKRKLALEMGAIFVPGREQAIARLAARLRGPT
jgi:hypothetical protein